MLQAACVWCVVLFLLAGCSGDDPPRTMTTVKIIPSCESDVACDPSQLCLYRKCRDTCSEDAQCDSDARCIDTGRGTACARESDNDCAADSDCPARQRCEDELCVATNGCGDGGCSDAAAEPEPDASQQTRAPDDQEPPPAASGMPPPPDAMAPSCTPGSIECVDKSIVACDAQGQPHTERSCAFVCVDAACGGACKSQARRCLGQLRQECDANGIWRGKETCEDVCTPDGCRSGCQEDARQCNAQHVMVCRSGRLTEEQACPFVCEEGACAGECVPNSTECTNGALASCGADGRWGAPRRCLNACADGACTGVCKPGTPRCTGSDGSQVCGENGQWGETVSCGGGACTGEGHCADTGCTHGMSPDWTAPADMGGVSSWNDPRWGDEAVVPFENGFSTDAGGYIALFDRSDGTIEITARILLGPSEMPGLSDNVYVGITTNEGNGALARAVTIPLAQLERGAGPLPLTAVEYSEYAGTWAQPMGGPAWVKDIAVWRGAESDSLSWAVALRVSLAEATVDPTRSFRMALRLHLDGRGDLFTPGNRPTLTDVPADWSGVSLVSIPCIGRVQLYPQ